MRPKAIVYRDRQHFYVYSFSIRTYINDTFNLTQDSSDRCANQWHGLEKARLANEDV
jgi:hypothetical protein